jgi:hypothetical protein
VWGCGCGEEFVGGKGVCYSWREGLEDAGFSEEGQWGQIAGLKRGRVDVG